MNCFFSCCCNKLPQTWWIKTTQFIILQFCWSEVQHKPHGVKIKAGLLSFLEALSENLCPSFSSFKRSRIFLGLQPLLPSSKPACCISDHSSVGTSPSCHIQWKDSAFKDPCDYIGLTQIIPDNFPISRSLILMTPARSLVPCKVTYSQVSGIRM